jgi:putative ABC transport system permease protein
MDKDNNMNEISKKKSGPIVFRLSVKDLWHEWILTLCLVLAISAVLSPLLLLFGLKYGIIEWGREYLTQDPRYREIRPLTSKSFNKEWFNNIENRNDVAFIMPMTRQISATIKASIKGKKGEEELNIIPTSDNDPLLLENGAKIPQKDECVLTQAAAEALKAKEGDKVLVKASRIIGSQYEYGTTELTVAGILPIRASELSSMYVQLPILEAVERYKDGQAVPELGWSGSTPKAYTLYDGVIIVVPEKLSLSNRTGFTMIESLDNKQLMAKAGFHISPEMAVYRLYTMKKPAGEESIKSVRNKLRGKNATLIPWTAPVEAVLVNESGQEISPLSLYGLSTSSDEAEAIGLSTKTSWDKSRNSTDEILKVMVPSDLKIKGEKFSIKVSKSSTESLTFPVTIASERTTESGVSFIPTKLAGILKLYQSRNITFDENLNEFVLFRRGYASFRLYGQSIFDIDKLRQFFAGIAIPVHTEIQEIMKVIELDKGMTLIFWLLAIVGITGSVASLIASLYASVERKKRELSVLRLIGLSGATLFRFPIYQGVLIGSGGFAISLILFSIFAELINNWFRPYVDRLLGFPMEEGISFCYFPVLHMFVALGGTVIISAFAAMVAAMRVSKIDPAEALRDE